MPSAQLNELVGLAKEAGLEEHNYLISYAMSEHASVNGRKRSVSARKRSVNAREKNVNINVNGRKRSVNVTENERRLKQMFFNERHTDATI